jgi:type VI protein secretion system component VasF
MRSADPALGVLRSLAVVVPAISDPYEALNERQRVSRRVALWVILVCVAVVVAIVVFCFIAAGWLFDFGSGPDALFVNA